MRNILTPVVVLGLLACVAPFARAASAPVDMPITWENPTPPAQSDLLRPVGDGDIWEFNLIPDGVYFVEPAPNWDYPGEGAADESWGVWSGGDGTNSLTWSSPQTAETFAVTVGGKIRKITGPGEGDGGEVEEKDFGAEWSGDVADYCPIG